MRIVNTYIWTNLFTGFTHEVKFSHFYSSMIISEWIYKMGKKIVWCLYSAWSTLHCGWILENVEKGKSFFSSFVKNNMTEECKGWKI